MIKKVMILIGLLVAVTNVWAVESKLDDLISLSGELKSDVIYPKVEAEYVLTVESRADIHVTRVNPPKGEGVHVRRTGQKHDYYFVGNDEYRISEYHFFVSSDEQGRLPIEGASLTHIAVDEEGKRRRVRNRAADLTIESLPIPADYQGYWLPSKQVQLSQQWSTESAVFRVGDSIVRTLSLFIEGSSIDTFPELKVDYPKSVSVYSEQPKFEEKDKGTTMILKQVIVPRLEGELDITGVAVPWFDTENSEMSVATTDRLTLNILPNQAETLALDDGTVDSNLWKWTTFVVSILWLLTVIFLFYVRKQSRTELEQQESIKMCTLQSALEQGDHVRIIAAWHSAEPELKVDVREWMDAYFACLYSADRKDANSARLKLIKRVKAHHKRSHNQKFDLAPIEP